MVNDIENSDSKRSITVRRESLTGRTSESSAKERERERERKRERAIFAQKEDTRTVEMCWPPVSGAHPSKFKTSSLLEVSSSSTTISRSMKSFSSLFTVVRFAF